MTAAKDRSAFLSERVDAAMLRLEDSIERLQDSRSRLRAMRQEIHEGRMRRAQLHDSAYGRLQARLESLPVIEQAKGILMVQTGCRAEQAFDILRRASQRSNIPVRDLAAQIVERTVAAGVPARSVPRAEPPRPAPPSGHGGRPGPGRLSRSPSGPGPGLAPVVPGPNLPVPPQPVPGPVGSAVSGR